MIHFFQTPSHTIYAVQRSTAFNEEDLLKLVWLFGNATLLDQKSLPETFVGPRATMITPWSTNAVEITQNMGIQGIRRIESFSPLDKDRVVDPMIHQQFDTLNQEVFTIHVEPEPIAYIEDIQAYNKQEGLALSAEEVNYLEEMAKRIGRSLTDSEVFGFSQVNSEHCRHKIFNGTFIIDGKEKSTSLFNLIKATSKKNPNDIVSAYSDNVAFIKGPKVEQFAPEKPDVPSNYKIEAFDAVISLKAETHNFPTTVEPFNGAATGSGGEIRDRMAGGRGSIPLAGTAVYMTSYSRLKENRPWENKLPARKWLYQNPIDILIKASNGASDFGNKFGQPLINGSLLTFEHEEGADVIGFDKVIMQAGGIGYAKQEQAQKYIPAKGDQIVILGGDNYRIGMGGAAVSSADTGAFDSGIELNAVQRSNPEMQKRAANTVRGMVENNINPIVSIHDHGAGGHLNCLSELVEETGGKINIDELPIGDPTLSAKEIIGNESQERMGLVIAKEHVDLLKKVADRERSPMYTVGEVSGDKRFVFNGLKGAANPIDLDLSDFFGSSPKTIMTDKHLDKKYEAVDFDAAQIQHYIRQVLKLEAVACKDWLTNKVDRCVGGKVAIQQCVGPLQLPLNNCGVMAIDYGHSDGIATAIGHAPVAGLIDAAAGAKNAIAESLTNLIWAPLRENLKSVSLSANWMWPCKNPGEDARLYDAVEAVSKFALNLGINVPTGKDSLSMAQKYPDKTVLAPGTVIISATGHCIDFTKVVTPVLKKGHGAIYYINLSGDVHKLGGSSFAQTRNAVGADVPNIIDDAAFARGFNAIQTAIKKDLVAAGHDISAGGMLTALLEMCFADNDLAAKIDLSEIEGDLVNILFGENAGILVQATDDSLAEHLRSQKVAFVKIGEVVDGNNLFISCGTEIHNFDIPVLRDEWYETSYLLDQKQTANNLATDRFNNYKEQPLTYKFPENFEGTIPAFNINTKKPLAAIIREKGSNSEREMANSLFRVGFDVRDVHMTDLITGREDLSEIQFLGAVGGFSNSDVLGSAKGWAGAIKYNAKAKAAIDNFFARDNTLSVGICNGCQLFLELDLINPEHAKLAKMTYNNSHKHESAFTSVDVHDNTSVMLSGLAGTRLGVWISHGEGKFSLPMPKDDYNIVASYGYEDYPSNPNGSDYNTAMICSPDGRHLATMPHIERSFFAWNWPYYEAGRKDKVSPWAQAFLAAKDWYK